MARALIVVADRDLVSFDVRRRVCAPSQTADRGFRFDAPADPATRSTDDTRAVPSADDPVHEVGPDCREEHDRVSAADAVGAVDPPTLRWRGSPPHRGLARIGGGAVLVAVAALVARNGLSGVEAAVFRWINRMPGAVATPTRVVMQAGALPAAFVAALIALTARKLHLASAIALSGAGAWILAKWVKVIVGRGRPGDLLEGVVFRGGMDTGLGFPSGHAALATAIATVAGPHLGRRGRIASWTVVAIVATAHVYVGAHLPLDVLGGVALGWTIGTAVNVLALRRRSRRSDAVRTRDALTPATSMS